jgi:hypothetical protein
MLKWLLSTCVILWSGAAAAQTVEELKLRLQAKEAELALLRDQVSTLEAQVGAKGENASASPPAELEDAERALERALVREGGQLLPAGDIEIEPNFSYSHINDTTSQLVRNAYGPGLALRVGLPYDLQFSFDAPYVFEERQDAGTANSGSGFGDIQFNASHQMLYERDWVPNVFIGVGYGLSTGKNTLFTSAQPSTLGSGFDELEASITATKRVDPLVLFAGYSFSHSFAATKGAAKVDLGDTHGIRFGSILATSPSSSLRLAFQLDLFQNTRIGGIAITGTSAPAAAMEVGGAFLLGKGTLVDLSIQAGLTRSAPDVRVTAAFPFRL